MIYTVDQSKVSAMPGCIGSEEHIKRPSERGELTSAKWLSGGGRMGQRIQSHDWAMSALGDLAHWPQSLRTTLSLCLHSPIATAVVWGRSRVHLYNDRYESFVGDALGRDFAEGWPDIWPEIRAAFEQAQHGETVERQHALKSFSFVPVRDERDEIGGVLVSVVEATHASEDREMFNYAVSHDVRSPLRSMEAMARILLEDLSPRLPEEVREFFGSVVQTARKLGDRADGLLSFNRVSHQPLTHQWVNVQALVEEILAEQLKSVETREIDIVVGELPEAVGDPEVIRDIFLNTVGNAFKFTRHVERPRIEIGGRRQENQSAYFVADNGVGFEMKYAAKLFRLFHRLHSEKEFEGAGMGLALTRRMIERHGGTIQAESQKGHGATFHFTLPGAHRGVCPYSDH